MKTSCAFLTLLVVALGWSPALAQQSEQDRIDAITREAVRQFAEARTGAPEQTRPTNPPEPGVKIELTLDDAVTQAKAAPEPEPADLLTDVYVKY